MEDYIYLKQTIDCLLYTILFDFRNNLQELLEVRISQFLTLYI